MAKLTKDGYIRQVLECDENGRPTEYINVLGRLCHSRYNENGEEIHFDDDHGHSFDLTIDSEGRVKRIDYAGDGYVEYRYNEDGTKTCSNNHGIKWIE